MVSKIDSVMYGLAIPAALLAAINDGTWAALARSPELARVFGTQPVRPCFYSWDLMVGVNKSWVTETDPVYVGIPDLAHPPGDVDPSRSLLIADLGPDQLIALDYRYPDRPGVIYATDDFRSPWWHITSSIEELLRILGPGASPAPEGPGTRS
jgi:hypothetical protein